MMPSYSIRRRIYFDDTDGGGVVYHTSYLRYMEHGRSEILLQHGFGPGYLKDELNIVFAVVELNARYLAPARLGDLIEVRTEPYSPSHSTLYFKQSVWLLDEQGVATLQLVSAEVKAVCLNASTFKPRKTPSEIKETVFSEC